MSCNCNIEDSARFLGHYLNISSLVILSVKRFVQKVWLSSRLLKCVFWRHFDGFDLKWIIRFYKLTVGRPYRLEFTPSLKQKADIPNSEKLWNLCKYFRDYTRQSIEFFFFFCVKFNL